jgi:acetyl esterase
MATEQATTVHLEPAARAFAAATADPPFPFALGPAPGRAALAALQAGPIAKLPVDLEELAVAGGPAGPVAVRILRPQRAPATLPVLLFLHGAGWVFGDARTHDRLVRELAVGAEAAVLFPAYRRPPEATYPTALEEAHAVARWVAAHGLARGLDPERLAVAGDGVGATLAAALTLLAKARGGPTIRWQVLFYPATDAACDTPSYRQFAERYWLRRDAMLWFWEQYAPDPARRAEITASPLRATIAQLAGLPAALVITAEADVLRDEGEAYAAKLRAAGVEVTAVRYQGIIHDFVMLNALANTAAARAAISQAIDWLRRGFAGWG